MNQFNFRLPLPRDSSWSTLLVSNRAFRNNSKGKVAILFLTAASDIFDKEGQIVSLLGSFIEEPDEVGIFVPQEINIDYGSNREANPERIDLLSSGPNSDGQILLLGGRSKAALELAASSGKLAAKGFQNNKRFHNAADYNMFEPVWDNAKENFIEFEIYQGKAQKENESLSPSFLRRARRHAVLDRPWSSPQGLSDNNFLYSFNMDDNVGKLRFDPHGRTIASFPNQPAYRDWALALMGSSDIYLGENGGFDDTVGHINGLNNDPEILLEKVIKPAQPKNRFHEGTSRSTCCFVDETTGGFMN